MPPSLVLFLLISVVPFEQPEELSVNQNQNSIAIDSIFNGDVSSDRTLLDVNPPSYFWMEAVEY